MFGKSRKFKNSFSEEINSCNENEIDGIVITLKRFEYFIKSLAQQIEDNNANVLEEIKGEGYEISSSIKSQFNNDSNLNYFLESILKSYLVSIYSYFEHILKEISNICDNNLKPTNRLKKPFNNYALKFNSFLKLEIITKLTEQDSLFQNILKYKKIRNDIVHNSGGTTFLNYKNSDDVIEFLDLVKEYLNIIIEDINEKYQLIE